MGEGSARTNWTDGTVAQLGAHLRAVGDDESALDRAIGELEAREREWRAHPAAFAEHYGLLAEVLIGRYWRTGDASHLDRARAHAARIESIDRVSGRVARLIGFLGHQLALAQAQRDGGSEAFASMLVERCAELRGVLSAMGEATLVRDIARQSEQWAAVAVAADNWTAAAAAHDLTARAADQLFRTTALERRADVLREFGGADAAAASALARAGRWSDAAVALEASRQRITRTLRDPAELELRLRPSDPELLDEFLAVSAEWAQAAPRYLDTAERAAAVDALAVAAKAEQRLAEVLERVRRVDGLEYHMRRASIAEIGAATSDAPILYVSTSRYDTLLILQLPGRRYSARQLVGLDNGHLVEILGEWSRILTGRSEETSRRRERAIAMIGAILEPVLARPMAELLTSQLADPANEWRWGPVTLVVVGPLSFIPVHAWAPTLQREDTELPTIMCLSYTPSARQAMRSRHWRRPAGAGRRLLSLADPDPPPAGLPALPCARLESATLAERAESRVLLHGAAATVEGLRANLDACTVLHLACHGQTDPRSPTESRLALAGAPLRAAEILQDYDLSHVELVILSACRSGQPHELLPDESLDLGSLFLAAGARGVVANLWPVDDLAAALFVSKMFELWNWGDEIPLTAAVAYAAQWLRELRVDELRKFAVDRPGWRAPVKRWTRWLAADLQRFNEPYYWAAFCCSGA